MALIAAELNVIGILRILGHESVVQKESIEECKYW